MAEHDTILLEDFIQTSKLPDDDARFLDSAIVQDKTIADVERSYIKQVLI